MLQLRIQGTPQYRGTGKTEGEVDRAGKPRQRLVAMPLWARAVGGWVTEPGAAWDVLREAGQRC